jgi:hypothetical protein
MAEWLATKNCVQLVVTVSNIFLQGKVKGKGKVYPRTGHKGPEGEQRYNFTLSLT